MHYSMFSLESDTETSAEVGAGAETTVEDVIPGYTESEEIGNDIGEIDEGLANVETASEGAQTLEEVHDNLSAANDSDTPLTPAEATAIVTECARIQRRMGMRQTSLSRYSLESFGQINSRQKDTAFVLEGLSETIQKGKEKGKKLLERIIKFFKDLWTRFKNWWNKGKNTKEENLKKIDEVAKEAPADLDDWLPVATARMIFLPALKTCDAGPVIEALEATQLAGIMMIKEMEKADFSQVMKEAAASSDSEEKTAQQARDFIEAMARQSGPAAKKVGNEYYIFSLGVHGVRVGVDGAVMKMENITADEEWDAFQKTMGSQKIKTPDSGMYSKLRSVVNRFGETYDKLSAGVETITKNMNDMLGQAKDLPPYIYGNLVFMQKSTNFSINQLMTAKQATDLYVNALHAAYKKEQAAKNAKPSGASGGSGQARLANA